MRRVINKNLDEADILRAAELLVGEGVQHLKLYFMIGLPTETDEDVLAIAALDRAHPRRASPTASANAAGSAASPCRSTPFVPKPWTPFQWDPMESIPSLRGKVQLPASARSAACPNVHARRRVAARGVSADDPVARRPPRRALHRGRARRRRRLVARHPRLAARRPRRLCRIPTPTCIAPTATTSSCRGTSSTIASPRATSGSSAARRFAARQTRAVRHGDVHVVRGVLRRARSGSARLMLDPPILTLRRSPHDRRHRHRRHRGRAHPARRRSSAAGASASGSASSPPARSRIASKRRALRRELRGALRRQGSGDEGARHRLRRRRVVARHRGRAHLRRARPSSCTAAPPRAPPRSASARWHLSLTHTAGQAMAYVDRREA